MPLSYIGRFAPSPTGPLHDGSLVAAMASYLDARAHHGKWLLRIENVDEARAINGAAEDIMATLAHYGMQWDDEVVWQNQRNALYQVALERLNKHIYHCGCTRNEIADSNLGPGTDGALIYAGTCRNGIANDKPARAIRLRVPADNDPAAFIQFEDRWFGLRTQNLASSVGDFVLKRADGFWAYQLAVVVDDANQGITHVVRGADLIESTPRQMYLYQLLNLPPPCYLHVPVLTNRQGEKLSKQTGAMALDTSSEARILAALVRTAQFLNLAITEARSIAHFWECAVPAWTEMIKRPKQFISRPK